ncbi:MAG: GTP 3',8-cyclase MoaA [Thaumarchaeota archaeon]|nr:GTP 3',8-cyclase MoaA [Nitrososphaerota archaeon]
MISKAVWEERSTRDQPGPSVRVAQTLIHLQSRSKESEALIDSYGRIARKLRISVTDACNFRCSFCMPKHPIWLPKKEILSFEEITRLATIFASLGVDTIRVSGGEPLVRNGVEELVEMLRGIHGVSAVSMTTNGFFLEEKARALKEAGLNVVTVSLHTLKKEKFENITGSSAYERVLRGITAAREVGLRLKINCVVIRGFNDDEVVDFASLACKTGITVRFIEYMPFDGMKLWNPEKVFSGREIIKRISESYELEPVSREPGSTSTLFGFRNDQGKIGLITSITAPFCGDCDRVRLKADGNLVPCLFSSNEYYLRPLLRRGSSDEQIADFIKRCFWNKDAGVERKLGKLLSIKHVRPMHSIGG